MWKSVRDGAKYFGRLAGIAIVIWTAVWAPQAVLIAQAQHDRAGSQDANEDSCVVRYERFAIQSYLKLERCIDSTNRDGWFDRLIQRTACNAEYISDSLQAESEYMACMSFNNIWPK